MGGNSDDARNKAGQRGLNTLCSARLSGATSQIPTLRKADSAANLTCREPHAFSAGLSSSSALNYSVAMGFAAVLPTRSS